MLHALLDESPLREETLMFAHVARRGAAACAVLTITALSGCATLTGGHSPQKVKIDSDPPGATVVIDGQPHGVTPTTVALDRKVEHHIELQRTGCAPVTADL